MVANSKRATIIALCLSITVTFACSIIFVGISIAALSFSSHHVLLPEVWEDFRTNRVNQLAASSTFTLCVVIHKFVYRLYLHPLSHFPGPKIAAFTLAFEFYHDVIQDGQYTWTIQSLHAQYGPIVRISPHELHVNDPQFQDQLYGSVTRPRDRWKWALGMFGIDSGMLTTASHELHRKRRAPLNPLFSKKAVAEFGSRIEGHVEKMCKRLEAYRGSDEPVRLDLVYGAFTLDVVTDYSFGEPYGALDRDDFLAEVTLGLQESAQSLHINKFFPWSVPIMKSIPAWLVKMLNPKMEELLLLQQRWAQDADKVIQDNKHQTPHRRTVFHNMLASPDLPSSDRNAEHLIATAQNIIGGGTTTTAAHLTRTTFHILNNPLHLTKLKTELETAIPDSKLLPKLSKLEHLPYLSQIITEGHRISHTISHRLQRISPTPLTYQGFVIPAGTPVGMTPAILAMDCPEPHTFNPERPNNNSSFNPFGRGPRSCLGINLAKAEIYFCLGMVMRRFQLELFETGEEDVGFERDYFAGLGKKGGRGLRVLVK